MTVDESTKFGDSTTRLLAASNLQGQLSVTVHSIIMDGPNIRRFDLRSAYQSVLPAFAAGAHIDVHMSEELVRSYSLCNSQEERHRYIITVSHDASSRGGSRHMHQQVKAGDHLSISEPKNNFPLRETSAHSVFIAGGIGITPIWCMIQRLERLGGTWDLFYSARASSRAAYMPELTGLRDRLGRSVTFNFDEESGGVLPNLRNIVDAAPVCAHLYCCGPSGMIDSFKALSLRRPPDTIHVEYFSSSAAPARDGGFTVMLFRSGRAIHVPANKSILDALLDEGIDVSYSCMEGVCGECTLNVLDGIPDHRDIVLTDAEHLSNRKMTVCCSGAKSPVIVLDL